MRRYLPAIVFVCAAVTLEPNAFSQSQAELTRREAARFERADAQLNKVYRNVLASVDAEGKRTLLKAQRAWLAYRDAEAEFEADEARGGTLARTLYYGALADLTEQRVKALREAGKARGLEER